METTVKTMRIKGTAVKSIAEFVKKYHKNDYQKWFNSLSKDAQEVINSIRSSEWYDIEHACIDPTKSVSNLFFEKDQKKGAWELGRYSAETGLSGIYKLYVRSSSPKHIINRANRAFQAYYENSEMKVIDTDNNSVTVHMNQPVANTIIEYRISGWMQKALEISGCKDVEIKMPQSKANGDNLTKYVMTWK